MKSYIDVEDLKFDYAFARGTLLAIFTSISLIILWLFITIYFLKNIQTLFVGFVIIVFIMTFLYFNGYFESGREFDFSKKQFRKYFGSGKYRIGKWKSLETPDYFLIKKNTANMNWWRTHSGYNKRGPHFLYDREVYFYYQLILITKGETDYIIYVTIEREENINIARLLAEHLNIPIYERTVDGDNIIYKASINTTKII